MTPFIKDKDIKKDWYLINAQDAAVGRLAAFISKVLRGKNKPTYNPHIDNGDFVVVTNIEKINLENLIKKKILDKSYKKIKILGSGDINIKFNMEVDFSSKSAKEKIEKVGGSLIIKKTD